MYKFIKLKDPDNKFDNVDLELSVNAENIDDIIEAFQDFLKGSGFEFDGELEIVQTHLFEEESSD